MENEFNGIEVFEVFTVLGIRLIRIPNTLLKWIWYVHTDFYLMETMLLEK